MPLPRALRARAHVAMRRSSTSAIDRRSASTTGTSDTRLTIRGARLSPCSFSLQPIRCARPPPFTEANTEAEPSVPGSGAAFRGRSFDALAGAFRRDVIAVEASPQPVSARAPPVASPARATAGVAVARRPDMPARPPNEFVGPRRRRTFARRRVPRLRLRAHPRIQGRLPHPFAKRRCVPPHPRCFPPRDPSFEGAIIHRLFPICG